MRLNRILWGVVIRFKMNYDVCTGLIKVDLH